MEMLLCYKLAVRRAHITATDAVCVALALRMRFSFLQTRVFGCISI